MFDHSRIAAGTQRCFCKLVKQFILAEVSATGPIMLLSASDDYAQRLDLCFMKAAGGALIGGVVTVLSAEAHMSP